MRKNLGLSIIAIYVFMMFLVQIIGGIVIVSLDIQPNTQEMLIASLIINFSMYASLFVIYILFLKGLFAHQFRGFKNNFQRFSLYILIGFGSIMATSVIVTFIYSLLGVTDQAENQAYWESILALGGLGSGSLIFISVFMAPVIEELVFRYAGFRILNRVSNNALHPAIMIVLTSFVFGFIHVVGDDFVQIIYYMALGGLLGYAYYRSKNILVPIGIHMAWNLFVSLSMFIVV